MDVLKMVWDHICTFAMKYIVAPVRSMGWVDALDILLLAFILYQLYRFCKNRRAGRVLLGLATVVVFGAAAFLAKLPALSYIAEIFAAAAFFCIVVLFQPELRDALEHLGNHTLINPGSNTISKKKIHQAEALVQATVDAVFTMSDNRTGALIVFEGLTKLGDYTQGATVLNAEVSSKLLQNLFYDKSPLHDGAVIIRDMRLYAASCVLPSNRGKTNFGTMGTRHRAAVGVTEVSDALVVVVSEQTGIVSVAQNGKLLRQLNEDTLRDILMTYIAGKAYLRKKRANMRQEYLKMLDSIAEIKPPRENARQLAEDFDEQIKEFVAEDPEQLSMEDSAFPQSNRRQNPSKDQK